MKNNNTKQQKKMSRGKKAGLIIGIVLSVLLVIGCAGYGVLEYYYSKMNYEPIDEDDTSTLSSEELESLLKEQETEETSDEDTDIGLDTDLDTDTDTLVLPDGETEEDTEVDSELLTTDAEEVEKEIKNNSSSVETLKSDSNVFHILLLGTDGRGSERGRTDSIIIASVNKKTQKITLTSVLRDIYLEIPGLEQGNRINVAYAYGGVSKLIKTIKNNFGIELDKYVRVNFYGFVDVIDKLGGVTVTVSKDVKTAMRAPMSEICRLMGKKTDDYMNFSTGTVTLNGIQALAFARVRKVSGGDFGRTLRQRQLLSALFRKIRSKDLSVSELNELANKLLPEVTTNMTKSQILSLMTDVEEYLSYDLVTTRIPIEGTYKNVMIRKMSVITIDFQKNISHFKKVVYEGAEP